MVGYEAFEERTHRQQHARPGAAAIRSADDSNRRASCIHVGETETTKTVAVPTGRARVEHTYKYSRANISVTMAAEQDATVLVVDDQEMVADMFTLQLQGAFEVKTAYGGEAALESIDETVDVVLLDRRMPDLSGDEVLKQIRARGYDCRVIMVTAVDVDLEILEMPCDAYIEKPVNGDALFDAIEQQLDIRRYDERISELYAISTKLAALEEGIPAAVLEESDEYREVRTRQESLKDEVDGLATDIDSLLLF